MEPISPDIADSLIQGSILNRYLIIMLSTLASLQCGCNDKHTGDGPDCKGKIKLINYSPEVFSKSLPLLILN